MSIPSFSTPGVNRQVLLSARPEGHPTSAHLTIARARRPEARDGKILVRNLYLSTDPAQRGWAESLPLGTVMRAMAVGVVVESRAAGYDAGDLVFGSFGWQDYAAVSPAVVLNRVRDPQLPASAYGGVLGMVGVTAWLALELLAPPQTGQCVLVSTAAGAVGSLVGQFVRRAGARAVGLTGSDEKIAKCRSRFGYSAAINYRTVEPGEALAGLAPGGFDTFFDNTGGAILDHAVRAMRDHGRIVQCGTAATPAWEPPPTGWRNERDVLMRRLTWTGFGIFDHRERFAAAVDTLTPLVAAGELEFDEEIGDGFETVPGALDRLFAGANTGKMLTFIG